MATFDITLAANKAYKVMWAERGYLMKLAMVPLLVKLVCVLVSLKFGDDRLIRISLIMLPGYFLEGWMLAHWIRYVTLGQRWPFRPSGDAKADSLRMYERARGVLSGMIGFVLVNMVIVGFFATFMEYVRFDEPPQEPDPQIAMIGMLMIGLSVVMFRFIWLYIPLSVNVAPQYYIRKVNKLGTSFYMIALWLVCYVPIMMTMQFLTSAILNMDGSDITVTDGIAGHDVAIALVQVFCDTLKNIICAAGMSYAIIEICQLKMRQQ